MTSNRRHGCAQQPTPMKRHTRPARSLPSAPPTLPGPPQVSFTLATVPVYPSTTTPAHAPDPPHLRPPNPRRRKRSWSRGASSGAPSRLPSSPVRSRQSRRDREAPRLLSRPQCRRPPQALGGGQAGHPPPTPRRTPRAPPRMGRRAPPPRVGATRLQQQRPTLQPPPGLAYLIR